MENNMENNMRPIGFVICKCLAKYFFLTKDKIYPYYDINGPDDEVTIFNDRNILRNYCINHKKDPSMGVWFVFYHYPEFPKDVTKWTEDDWFQYNLKYG